MSYENATYTELITIGLISKVFAIISKYRELKGVKFINLDSSVFNVFEGGL